ncbi:MAG: hypothetical protein FJ301_07410 [Planctomycetes bacterium]|nr:hypothetical protein [Planctomycetota bacterium]
MRRLANFAAAVAVALPLAAQAPAFTAHPQDTLQNNTGNIAPLGVLGNGALAEARTMILVPRRELPPVPASLSALYVHAQSAVNIDYATLNVLVGPTSATGLNLTFNANHSIVPWPALLASNLQVAYTGGWTRIPFASPFVYDGTASLLIEIVKVVQPGAAGFPSATMSTSSSPPRTDRPPMTYVFGGPGSGAATAAVGTQFANSIAYRLEWTSAPTIRHRGNPGVSGNQYNLGGSVTVTFQGTPGNLYVMAAGTGYLPQDVPIPGLAGALRLANAATFASGALGLSGEYGVSFVIPTTPALVGFFIAYQGVALDIATQTITFTNGSDHFVNP